MYAFSNKTISVFYRCSVYNRRKSIAKYEFSNKVWRGPELKDKRSSGLSGRNVIIPVSIAASLVGMLIHAIAGNPRAFLPRCQTIYKCFIIILRRRQVFSIRFTSTFLILLAIDTC